MRTSKFIYLALTLLGCLAFVLYFTWPREHVEIQVRENKQSPSGEWVAVVQLEVQTVWIVNDAEYTVRLKGTGQKSTEGDLVMVVPVKYSDPEPSIDWRNGTLVVTLGKEQNYHYFLNSVDGVAVILQRNRIKNTADSKP